MPVSNQCAANSPAAEQQQHVVRVVHLLHAQPAIAVVPLAHPLPVQAGQLRAEHRVQVGLGVAADRRVDRIQRQIGEVVQLREQVHLRELADTRQEGEPHVRVRVLDHPVQPAQKVAVGARHVRRVHQRVQDRLVVLVDQHGHPLPGMRMHRSEQMCEPLRRGGVTGGHARLFRRALQLRHHARLQMRGLREAAAAEAQSHHRMALRPLVAAVDVEPREQLLAALEQLLQGVQEQALAEPPWPRQEVVRSLVEEPFDIRRLVHVVAVLLAQLAERLDADGQPASGHRGYLTPSPKPEPSEAKRAAALQLPGLAELD